jgi:hypothetical protein
LRGCNARYYKSCDKIIFEAFRIDCGRIEILSNRRNPTRRRLPIKRASH